MWLQAKIRAICHSRVELRFIPFRQRVQYDGLHHQSRDEGEGRKEGNKTQKSLSSI